MTIGSQVKIGKMKKETLEEAAERNHNEQKLNTYTPYSFNDAFKDGAKWQANRSYSDTQLYSEIENLIITWNIDGTLTAGALTRQIIEQIKKK